MWLCTSLSQSYAGKTQVGGHLKLTLYDYTTGERSFVDSATFYQTAKGARTAGIAFQRLTLHIVKEIKEMFSITAQPDFQAFTGATPRIGRSVGEKLNKSEPRFNGWQKAFLRIMIPYPLLIEVSGGILFPRFTMDYGAELFWEEEYNGSMFSINSALGLMHGTGIEIYRAFELGAISLPVYLYILNGSGNLFHDNNDTPEGMIHIEPEIGPLKLFGSLLYGKYDDDGEKNVVRWSGGLSLDFAAFSFRTEYAAGLWEKSMEQVVDSAFTYSDTKPWGVYFKFFYNFSSWAKAMIHYNYVKNNYAYNQIDGLPGKEIFLTITPGVQFYFMDCLSVQLQLDIGNWKREVDNFGTKDNLKFVRSFLGLRATF